MLETVLKHINNYFLVEVVQDVFTVRDGGITLPFLQSGQYFRIIGSVFNDGVYRYGDELELTDETFDGTVWALAIPKAVIALAEEISAWVKKNGTPGPFTSENFVNYSYTKASNSRGVVADWQDVFKTRLNDWRRIGGI